MKKRNPASPPEAPSVITPLHVKDRAFVSEVAEGRRTRRVVSNAKAWRKLTPLEAAFARGQLAGGASIQEGGHSAEERLAAGKRYAGIYDGAQTGGRDSTQMVAISRSGGGASVGVSQLAAVRALARIEAKLGARDARIIRMVCGEQFAPVDAVRAACGEDYKHTIAARFREALDALVEVI